MGEEILINNISSDITTYVDNKYYNEVLKTLQNDLWKVVINNVKDYKFTVYDEPKSPKYLIG